MTETRTDQWATAHGLALSATTEPVARRYLTRRRDLRRAGAVAAPIVAAQVTASTGVDLHLSGLVWVLGGYLIGCISAELWLARLPITEPTRRASLTARTRRSYLPRAMYAAQFLVPLTAVILAVIAAVEEPPTDPNLNLFSFATTPTDLRHAAITAGAVAVLAVLAAAAGQRVLIRRPQPLDAADRVALDDALRASSIHIVGATALATADLLIASQLAYLSNLVTGPGRTALVLGAVAATAAAWLMWSAWANRSWPRPRRAALLEPEPTKIRC